MNIANILAEVEEFTGWCSQAGVRQAFSMLKTVLKVLRIVVPIALIVMTTLDITKKVINPDEKDGQKKIMTRVVAGVIVFFVPTIISLAFKLIDIGKNGGNAYKDSRSNLSACWDGDYGG